MRLFFPIIFSVSVGNIETIFSVSLQSINSIIFQYN